MTAQATRAGGMFLAIERGARGTENDTGAHEIPPATAPLFEIAALHDGQPPVAWLGYLKAQFES